MLQMDIKPTLDRLHSPLKHHHLGSSAAGWPPSHSLNEMASKVFACLGAGTSVTEGPPTESSQPSHFPQQRLRAVIETADSAASTSGRPEGPDFSHGASIVRASLGSDRSSAFVGVFHSEGANGSSLAWEAASRLGSAVEEEAASKSTLDEQLLQSVCAGLDQELGEEASGSSLSGCAALFSRNHLTICTLGRCSIVIGQSLEAAASSPEQPSFALHQQERCVGVSKEEVTLQTRTIPTPRFFSHPVRQGDCFLILGTAGLSEAMSDREATDFVFRWREQPGAVGSTAAALAQEVHERLVARHSQVTHVSLAVAHFDGHEPLAPLTPAPRTPTGSPPRAEGHAGAPQQMVLSPSGRRVHFLEPVQGPGAPVTGASPPRAFLSPFHNTGDRSFHSDGSTSTESEIQQQSFPDSSSLISSGSQLSQPNMSIPEEGTLPGSHSALKLPPPLLPPVRKAYPSGELTSDVASPIRKAALTRSASQNSPKVPLAGRLYPQTSLPTTTAMVRRTGTAIGPMSRQSSGSQFGSRSRGGSGEEGRVRGGMPRIASLPSRLGGTPTTPSPISTSGPSSPVSGESTPTAVWRASSGELPEGLVSMDSGGRLNPWHEPLSPAGSKSHGRTTALRMLQSSGGRGKAEESLSAPADLDRPLLVAVSAPGSPERRSMSGSETETCASSASSGLVTVTRVPPLTEPSLALQPPATATANRPPRCGASYGGMLRRTTSNGSQQPTSPHIIPVCSQPPPRTSSEGRSHGSGRIHLPDSAGDVSRFMDSLAQERPRQLEHKGPRAGEPVADSVASLGGLAGSGSPEECVSGTESAPTSSAESARTLGPDP